MSNTFSTLLSSILITDSLQDAFKNKQVRLTYGDHSFDTDVRYKHYGYEKSSSLSISVFLVTDTKDKHHSQRLAEFIAHKDDGKRPHVYLKFNELCAFLYDENDNSSMIETSIAKMELQTDILLSLKNHETDIHELMEREFTMGMECYIAEEQLKEKQNQARIEAINNKYRKNTDDEILALTEKFHNGTPVEVTVIQKHSMEPLSITLHLCDGKVSSDKHSSFNLENAIKYINNSRTEVFERK
ncbi:hypothetical protein LMH73_021395 [Vibrio splendidus]|nr:hypothetical protein [Vibrio splendidus]MCC4880551.1 hypothetical protein [Vibrio splendidus]